MDGVDIKGSEQIRYENQKDKFDYIVDTTNKDIIENFYVPK